jgi:2,5-diketo-D-gluconate reductase A
MLSANFLMSQGECCGNGCVNCPYIPRHKKGNKNINNSKIQSKSILYNWSEIMSKYLKMPMIGLGTWLLPNEIAEEVTTSALNLGYRHIDTAQAYRNETGIGDAIKKSSLSRDDLFITTKMWPGMEPDNNFQNYDSVINSCNQSLSMLQINEIDLYLIHAPFAKDLRLEQWQAFLDLKKDGKVKNIGVSNYNSHHLQEIEDAGFEMPAANQIEIHPYHLIRPTLDSYMTEHKILPIAYSSLAPIPNWREGSRWNGKPEQMKTGSMPYEDIAIKYQVSVPQLLLKWGIQMGYPVLPKSVKKDRLKENINLDHFEISLEDMNALTNAHLDQQKCLAWSNGFDPLDSE